MTSNHENGRTVRRDLDTTSSEIKAEAGSVSEDDDEN